MAGLYVPIRGDYTEFQKDIKRLQGIARTSAQELSDIFSNAFSKGDASRGLSQIGMALKKLGAAANTVGAQFKPAIAEISEFAKKCGVSANQVERLVTQMGYAARERQMISSLRTLQRQAGLTESALAQLARHRGLFAESGSIASEGLGVRTVAKIKADIKEAEAAFKQFQVTANLTGESTQRQFEAMTAKVRQFSMELMTASQREAFLRRERYDSLVAQAGRGGTSFAQFEARNTARNAVNAFQELNGRLPRPSEIRQIAQACGQSATQIRRMRDELDHSSNAFKALIGYAQVWLTFGAFEMAKGFVKTAMEIENVKVAFQAIYGSADMAEKKLEYVRKVSDQLGLSFLDTAEGAKKLFAAAQGTPVEGKANMVFKSFSDMSAALKLTGDETKGVFLAISQMISKGKVSAEELRQQLAERMPGAVNLFAKSIGVTTKQLDKMLQGGEVTLEHFLKFAEEVGKTYSAGARMAGHSLQAELNRLGNTWIDFQTKSTNTGQLAEGVRQLNEMLKASLEIIAKLAPHMNSLVKIAFAGWLSSSLIPGGKLNAVIAGLATACSNCVGPIKAFLASMTAAVVGAGTLTGAVKALGAAMWSMAKNPAFLALMATGAIALKVLTDDADDAKESFKKVTESMDEMAKKRLELAQADKASNFGSNDVIVGMSNEIEKKIRAFEEERNKLQEQFNNLLTYDHFRNERVATTPGQLAVQGMLGQLDQFKKELREALGKNDITAMDVLGNRFWGSWKEVQQKLAEMKIDEGVKASIARGWAEFAQLIDGTKVDLLKKLDELEKLGSGSLATLGVSFASTEKEAKKFAKAVGSSELGKFVEQMQKMETVHDLLGNTSMEFSEAAAAAADYGVAAKRYLDELGAAPEKLEAHKDALNAMDLAVVKGTVSYDEYEAAAKRVQDEDAALREETQNVSQKMIDFALAMGGTEQAFNLVMQLCANAGSAFNALGVNVQGAIADIRDFQISAATAMYATQAIAGGQAAKVQFHSAEARQALRKGDEKGFYAAKEAETRAKSKTPIQVNGQMMMGWQEEYKWGRKLQELNDSNKKPKGGGGKKGGGRVDNTAEKYNSAYEGFRKEIAKLQGEVDKVTLDKKFADMDKQLKGSTVDIKALKKEYYEAFTADKVKEMDKGILQLSGNTAQLKQIEIAEYMKGLRAETEGMAKAAEELGMKAPDLADKLALIEKLKQGEAREESLQKQLPYYEKFSWFDGNRVEALEKQNELIQIQYEKLKNSGVPQELIDRWREIEELQNRVKNGNDVLAGITLGAKKYALEMGNMAENVSDLVQKSFGDMADAFVDMVMTGKANFTDLANSIIKDLMRIAMQQAIVGPIANGIGNLFGSFSFGGGGGLSAAKSGVMSAASASSAIANVHIPALAYGGVLTGLHGFSSQIVSRPTLFSYGSQLTKFAKGGVMGEAGPEAVMPLMRTASGHLGVRSEGSQAPIVNVVINNSTGQSASQKTKTDNQGNKSIEVMIGDMAAQQMMKTGTSLNKAARSFSGVSQQVTRR